MLYKDNRERLYAAARGELIVITAYSAVQQSGDMAAPFLQEASFFWVTGITEPGWKVILDTARKQAILVRPERSKVDIIFNGQSDDDAIQAVSGITEIISEKDFEAKLRLLHRKHTVVGIVGAKQSHEFILNPAQAALETVLKRIFDSVQQSDQMFAKLRAIKQPEEIEIMQAAIDVTCHAFAEVRRKLPDLKTEYEIEAEFIYEFRRANADHAYEPIVASGAAACTLHYNKNNAKIHARDMILIDIGARVGGYSADITRTYCLNPTKRQIAVHAAVEKAEKAIIDLIAPGLAVRDYIDSVDEIMKKALCDLGLLNDKSDDKAYRHYFPHSVSHGLGIDTHDSLGSPPYFEAGMVLTVEPGIYIPEEGIGVRIEDDILVTSTGRKNLSQRLSTGL